MNCTLAEGGFGMELLAFGFQWAPSVADIREGCDGLSIEVPVEVVGEEGKCLLPKQASRWSSPGVCDRLWAWKGAPLSIVSRRKWICQRLGWGLAHAMTTTHTRECGSDTARDAISKISMFNRKCRYSTSQN